MLFLLKQELKISDNELPGSSEISNDANIKRINIYTEYIVDNKTRSLDDTCFIDIWDTVVKAIIGLGGNQLEQQCECLRKADINEKDKDIMLGLVKIGEDLTVLRDKKKEILERLAELRLAAENISDLLNHLSKRIKEKTEEVDKWALEDKMFVETRASTRILKRLRKKHTKTITIVGSFGVGKTCTTRHIALLLRFEGYRILPVSTLAEIKELDDEKFQTVFIVDDFCGRECVKQPSRDIKTWRNMSEDLVGSNSKIVVCCMSMIFQHSDLNCLTYFRSCVMDLNCPGLSLSNSELRSIAKMHADMDEKLIKKYAKMYSFFPFLCKQCQVFSEEKADIPQVVCHEAILSNANIVYTSQMDIFRRDDKAKFTALALIVMLNNYIKEDCFTKMSKEYISVLDKMNTTFDACELDINNSLSDIKEELNSMNGTYIVISTDSRNKQVYSARNLDIYRMLVTNFKTVLPEYYIGPFPSHQKYSKLLSILTNVQRKANTLTSSLCSPHLVAIFATIVISLLFILYVTLIFKGLERM